MQLTSVTAVRPAPSVTNISMIVAFPCEHAQWSTVHPFCAGANAGTPRSACVSSDARPTR